MGTACTQTQHTLGILSCRAKVGAWGGAVMHACMLACVCVSLLCVARMVVCMCACVVLFVVYGRPFIVCVCMCVCLYRVPAYIKDNTHTHTLTHTHTHCQHTASMLHSTTQHCELAAAPSATENSYADLQEAPDSYTTAEVLHHPYSGICLICGRSSPCNTPP